MLCDGCSKSRVCKYAEQCRALEQDIKTIKIENIISHTINCKEYSSIFPFNEKPFTYPRPITSGKTWDLNTYTTSTIRVDPEIVPKSFIGVRNTEDVTEFWSIDKPSTYDYNQSKSFVGAKGTCNIGIVDPQGGLK